jgi:alanine-glyoxylate transaminase / serine-glyoxylate transaminase / serine-pyruvate transaminase
MDGWGIDVVLTASQKGLGTPPGLSILVASQRAMKVSSVFMLIAFVPTCI